MRPHAEVTLASSSLASQGHAGGHPPRPPSLSGHTLLSAPGPHLAGCSSLSSFPAQPQDHPGPFSPSLSQEISCHAAGATFTPPAPILLELTIAFPAPYVDAQKAFQPNLCPSSSTSSILENDVTVHPAVPIKTPGVALESCLPPSTLHHCTTHQPVLLALSNLYSRCVPLHLHPGGSHRPLIWTNNPMLPLLAPHESTLHLAAQGRYIPGKTAPF